MPVDSFAKRMAVAGLGGSWVGPNVFPGETVNVLGRAAAAWNYSPGTPVPPTPGAGVYEKITLGTKESLGVTPFPTLGGWQSW